MLAARMRDRAAVAGALSCSPAGAYRAAARRSASGQLPAADRRRPGVGLAAGGAGLRHGGPAAGGAAAAIGTALWLALAGEAEQVYAMLREEGFVKPTISLDADAVLDYLRPIIEPADRRTSRSSGRGCGRRRPGSADPRSPAHQLGRQLNLPPSYLLIHRVTLSTVGCCASWARQCGCGRNCTGGCRVLIRRGRRSPREVPRYHQAESRRLSMLRRCLRAQATQKVDALPVLHGAGPGQGQTLGELPAAGARGRGRSCQELSGHGLVGRVSAVGGLGGRGLRGLLIHWATIPPPAPGLSP